MKLIRHKYIDIIEPEKLLIDDCPKQRKLFLKKKLNEELEELKDSKFKDPKEYADVIQVLEDLAISMGLDFKAIMLAKDHKKIIFGDFSKGVYLIK